MNNNIDKVMYDNKDNNEHILFLNKNYGIFEINNAIIRNSRQKFFVVVVLHFQLLKDI